MTLMALVGMLAVVPTALADNTSVVSGYGGQASKPVVVVKGESTGTKPAAAGPSTLPFTGADLGVLVGAGGVLLALGLGMRRLGRDKA